MFIINFIFLLILWSVYLFGLSKNFPYKHVISFLILLIRFNINELKLYMVQMLRE